MFTCCPTLTTCGMPCAPWTCWQAAKGFGFNDTVNRPRLPSGIQSDGEQHKRLRSEVMSEILVECCAVLAAGKLGIHGNRGLHGFAKLPFDSWS